MNQTWIIILGYCLIAIAVMVIFSVIEKKHGGENKENKAIAIYIMGSLWIFVIPVLLIFMYPYWAIDTYLKRK